MKDNSPRWNLDSIFTNIKSPEYKSFLEDFKKLISTVQQHINTDITDNSFSDWLKKYIDYSNQLSFYTKTLNAYSYLIYSTETTNTEYLDNISKIQNLCLQSDQIQLAFEQILSRNELNLSSFYQKFPEYKKYKYLLNEAIINTKHSMSPAEEQITGELQQTGGDAWDRLHEQLISNLTDSQTNKSFNELRNDAYSADPQIRRESYLKEKALLKQNQIAFSACLNNLKGETILLNRHRKYNLAIDRSLASSRMNKKTLESLISAIEKSKPLWESYFTSKANYLKKNNLTASKSKKDGLAFYDLFAPFESSHKSKSSLNKSWTYDEAIEYVINKFYSFSKDMGDFAKQAKENNWIDAQIRSGKVGGAYDEDIPYGHQSRVLTNFTGAFSDVITLAHELGHAYHFHCMKNQPELFFDYPMTLAETASTFAETIVKQDIIANSEGEDKISIIEADLQDVAQVLIDILSRYYFESSVFEKRSEGELNAEDFCKLMTEAQRNAYGTGLNEETHEYMWAVKSHYYSTSLDFYNFPYAFGQLFAIALFLKYKESPDSFPMTYIEILKNTGSMSCEEAAALAGIDISTESFWLNAINFYQPEIKEFEKFCK